MKKLFPLLLIIILVVVEGADKYSPITTGVNLDDFEVVLYVSATEMEGKKDGTQKLPFDNIAEAVSALSNLSESNQAAVLVAGGIYTTSSLELKPYVHLFGGFQSATWKRDINQYVSTLVGGNDSRMIIAADNTTIDGFTISDAVYRGKGAAIYCDGTSPVITNNIFSGNKALKPLNWNPEYWHETANDGGAIYGTNGASPLIKNNFFIRNKTENGRGAAVAFDGNCNPEIINNYFYENHSGLDDPMRSSDGAAISMFRWCGGVIEDNLFLSNYAGSSNDGGAVFIALWSSTAVKNNIFVDNECGDDAGALFVGGQEHRYDSPLDPFPPKEKFFVSITDNVFIGNRNPSMNSGAMRFTMESRGEFVGNIVAQNNGVYFQRSETDIKKNIILDNMLLIETKEGLGKSHIYDNLIWADFYWNETDAELKNNNMLHAEAYPGNYSDFPDFMNDMEDVEILSSYFLKGSGYSELILNGDEAALTKNVAGRVVNSNSHWGVVKSFENNVLQVWGNFSAATSIKILPTYTIRK